MSKPRSTLIFIMLLALGLFVAVPVPDVPETAYDESQGVPYEATPPIVEDIPPVAASAVRVTQGARRISLTTPALATRSVNGTAHCYAAGRADLALLCTLLC